MQSSSQHFLGFFNQAHSSSVGAFSATIFYVKCFQPSTRHSSPTSLFFMFFQPARSTINQPATTQHDEPLVS
jgi:hypothetical protein